MISVKRSAELARIARTYLLLGLNYYDAGEQKKAIANYDQAIEFRPDNENLVLGRAELLMRLDRLDDASSCKACHDPHKPKKK